MKAILLLAAFLSLILLPARGADDAERTKLAAELLSTMRLEETLRSGWTAYPPREGVAEADHVDPPEVSRALWLKLQPAYVKAYAEVYSADELRSLIAFFKSPIGQTYLDKMPELNRKLLPAHGIIVPQAVQPK